jgi:hypothetical protein
MRIYKVMSVVIQGVSFASADCCYSKTFLLSAWDDPSEHMLHGQEKALRPHATQEVVTRKCTVDFRLPPRC